MARGVNKVIAIGNLGHDPETRYVPSGAAVTTFSIACSESWIDKQTGEKKERTEWINCEVWGKMAEACATYLKKGSQCFVEGKLQTDSWDDNGTTKYRTKVRLDNVQFLGGKQGETTSPNRPAPATPDKKEFDDDIPF